MFGGDIGKYEMWTNNSFIKVQGRSSNAERPSGDRISDEMQMAKIFGQKNAELKTFRMSDIEEATKESMEENIDEEQRGDDNLANDELNDDGYVEKEGAVLTLFTWDIVNDGVRRGRSRCMSFWQNHKYGYKYRRKCYGVGLETATFIWRPPWLSVGSY